MEEQKQDKENDDNDQDSNPPSNSDFSEDVVEPDTNVSEEIIKNGKLLLDATCAPADIAFPTDLGLLNEAREKLEHIIDVLHEPLKGSKQKPRTYRKKARKDYLTIAKQRKVSTRKMYKAVGK